MSRVTLRPVGVDDLDAVFEQMRDPESVRMAAFTAGDPDDRPAFDAHMARVQSDTAARFLAVVRGPVLVGTIGHFVAEGTTEVTFWIGRAWWGQGIATEALGLLLAQLPDRPVRARAASDNTGSLRVLQKAGFRPIGTERSMAPGRGVTIEETVLELR